MLETKPVREASVNRTDTTRLLVEAMTLRVDEMGLFMSGSGGYHWRLMGEARTVRTVLSAVKNELSRRSSETLIYLQVESLEFKARGGESRFRTYRAQTFRTNGFRPSPFWEMRYVRWDPSRYSLFVTGDQECMT